MNPQIIKKGGQVSFKTKTIIALLIVPAISALAAMYIVNSGALKTPNEPLYTPIPTPTSNKG